MNLHRNFLTCPYLNGSAEGVLCRAASLLIRDISDIDLGICMSKHYEHCYVYYERLQEMALAEMVFPPCEERHPGINPA
ncbi:MAG: hypothetical protein ACOYVJ_03525 [Nitrospirota bacterium]